MSTFARYQLLPPDINHIGCGGHPAAHAPWPLERPLGTRLEKESFLLTAYWPESTTSSRLFGGPASRHGRPGSARPLASQKATRYVLFLSLLLSSLELGDIKVGFFIHRFQRGGVPRGQKMLKRHLRKIMYYRLDLSMRWKHAKRQQAVTSLPEHPGRDVPHNVVSGFSLRWGS